MMNKHGQSTYGHWTAFCKVSRQREEPHFCCPDACELYNADLAVKP